MKSLATRDGICCEQAPEGWAQCPLKEGHKGPCDFESWEVMPPSRMFESKLIRRQLEAIWGAGLKEAE